MPPTPLRPAQPPDSSQLPGRLVAGPQQRADTRSSPYTLAPHTRRVTDAPAEIVAAWSQRLRTEGPHANNLRTAVWLKHASYLLTIIVVCAIVHAALAPSPSMAGGGVLLLGTTTVMLITTTLGMMFMPDARHELAEMMRKFVFAYTLLPALGIAGLQRFVWSLGSGIEGDLLTGTINGAIPFLFAIDTFFPMLLLIKAVTGLRTIRRSTDDTEEAVGLWTRQDGLQR